MYDTEFKLDNDKFAYVDEQFCGLLGQCLQQVMNSLEYDELRDKLEDAQQTGVYQDDTEYKELKQMS